LNPCCSRNPLVLFTLSSQAAIGLFVLIFVGSALGLPGLDTLVQSVAYPVAVMFGVALVSFGLFMSTVHLGKPLRFYRGFNNLRHSPVAREGAGVALFMSFATLHALAAIVQADWMLAWLPALEGFEYFTRVAVWSTGVIATIGAGIGLYYMYRCYRIKARPFWDHKQTGFAFVGCTFYLGAFALAGIAAFAWMTGMLAAAPLLSLCSIVAGLGLTLEGLGLYLHARDMNGAESEGAVSHYVQKTTFGKTWFLRNVVLVVAALGMFLGPLYMNSALGFALWMLMAVAALATAIVGRALFYVLVIPTTMPGAFFWKNKAFEEHARDIGLAEMPQVGVVPLKH